MHQSQQRYAYHRFTKKNKPSSQKPGREIQALRMKPGTLTNQNAEND